MERAVTLNDPQVEHDARSWRLMCRAMSVVSLFTCITFIILVSIFLQYVMHLEIGISDSGR
ncbi:hypothetical protein L227DRAFT_514774 [Lentinus tigrinus ALCF2SS1-6]|nr:hypothetical protein L227DRAFT_514774 [Lentinus tigrinus ALCF2SS1-6]